MPRSCFRWTLSSICTARPRRKSEPRPTREEAEAAVRTLIRWAGDNPGREGLLDTPKRVVKAYEQLYKGYSEDPADYLGTVFEEVEGYNDIVSCAISNSIRIASTICCRSSARCISPITPSRA